MKKIFMLLIILVISISMVASFAFAAKSEKVKVLYWTWMDLQDLVAQFNGTQDEIEVELVPMAHADIMAKMTIALAANKGGPDIFDMTWRHSPNFTTTGKLYDMTADVSDIIGKLPEDLQGVASFKGKVYGVPSC